MKLIELMLKMKSLIRKVKWLLVITFISLGFSIIYTLYFFSLRFITPQVLIVYNSPFPILTPILRAGETLKYRSIFKKYTNTKGILTRTFVCVGEGGTNQIKLTEAQPVIIPIGNYDATVSVITPKDLDPGSCYMATEGDYYINPLKIVQVFTQTQLFKIIK